MQNNLVDSFVDKKAAESLYISLDDGDSVKVVSLKEIKIVTKVGFSGEEKEVLRLTCEVETSEGNREKSFDNGTSRFAKEMQDNGISIGSSFTLTRTGLLTKTRYTLSGVAHAGPQGASAPAEVAQAAPATAKVAPGPLEEGPATTPDVVAVEE